jgi:aminopeptidase N
MKGLLQPKRTWANLKYFGFLCLLLFTILTFTSDSLQVTSPLPPYDSIRLPGWIKANHYDLDFQTNLKDFTFNGTVEIHLSVKDSNQNFIVVHKKDLKVEFKGIDANVEFSHIISMPELEYLIIVFKQNLVQGDYKLSLIYSGVLNTNMNGYYLSSYTEADEKKYMATTQFESTAARYAFPCLDEPEQKSIFRISMTISKEYNAISNMPQKNEISMGDWKKIEFEPTVKMSTYLVAFVVSKFESISAHTDNGVKVSVYTVPSQTRLGKYALDIAVPTLEFYQKTYGIDFPLPKLDMIAIPDFSAGGILLLTKPWKTGV